MVMSGWRATICVGCWVVVLSAAPVRAQSAQPAAKAPSAPPAWKQKEVSFRDAKPVLGLPEKISASMAQGSVDGEVFFENDGAMEANSVPKDVYGVATSGEVKHFTLKKPSEYDLVRVINIFVTDHDLVALLVAAKSLDTPMVARYFLSISDHDGDGQKLLPLDVKFKPLKIAMFGDGGFLLLGWDEANLQPELALLKDDGSLRRFVDLDNRASDGGLDALSMKGAAKPETLQLLERARFSPFGKNVLLAQPGAAAPVHDLTAFGEDRKIPVQYPGGWVMHDVLAGPSQWTMVVRMQPESRGKDAPGGNYQRLFEVDAAHGSLVRELTFETPSVTDVTCAPAGKIAAMYLRPVPDASQPAAGVDGKKVEQKLELVVGTAPR